MNIGLLLTKSARSYPDRLAVTFGQREWTYSQFNERVNRLANALNRLGIGKGNMVSILGYNCPQFLESLFACFKAGICAVPINFRLHPKEYSYIIDDSDSLAVIFSEEFKKPLYSLKEQMPKVKSYICMTSPDEGMLGYEGLLAASSPDFRDVEVDRNDLAWLFYTSGTTGKSKGAMLSHHNLLAMTMNFYADMCPLGPEDAVLHAAPLSHGSGLYALPNVGKAAANVILDTRSFEASAVFEAIQNRKITNMFAAPTMVKRLVTDPDIDKYDLSSLRALIYGGAPMYVEDLKEAIRKLGKCLVQLYGQGECPMTLSYFRQEEHLLEGTERQLKRLASAGIPRTDVELKIVDEDGNELPPGRMGDIVARAEEVMLGYWKQPEATAQTLKGGWLHTGDMGMLDDDGYLYIMDRSKDLVISGGENIYPREVEEVILRHPAVHEVAVVGVRDDYWGEKLVAVVSLKKGRTATAEDIINICKDNMASYKKPKIVHFVDDLPKNSYGKILKREIRERFKG